MRRENLPKRQSDSLLSDEERFIENTHFNTAPRNSDESEIIEDTQ